MDSLCEFVYSSFSLQKGKKKKKSIMRVRNRILPKAVFLNNGIDKEKENPTYLCLDLRLPLLQELCHSHGPVLA